MRNQPSEVSGQQSATHRCKTCGARWHLWQPGPGFVGDNWQLVSATCGPCCDNVPMIDQMEPLDQRAALVARMRKQKEEVEQYFRDVGHWNAHVRKPGEALIHPDPDGQLSHLLAAFTSALAQEDLRISEPNPKS